MQDGDRVKALEVLGQVVNLRRTQLGLTQAALAERLAAEGVNDGKVDPTVVLRIEKGTRDVRVDEFLSLAVSLEMSPAELVAPLYAGGLTVGDRLLGAAQVLAWFAGDVEAPNRRDIALDDVREQARDRQFVSDLVEEVDLVGEALTRKDRGAVIWAAARMQSTLAALIERVMTDDELGRIADDYGLRPGGN